MTEETVAQLTHNPTLDLALDTIKRKKQALIFVNARNSAEKVAEDIAKNLPLLPENVAFTEKLLKAIETPTRQCHRLAEATKKGIAFHHSGLTQKQKTLIEDAFREGTIRIIACTPTLAAGVDLPAFRAIIRNTRRFGPRGMMPIPVLEYLQMCGRAGRPSYDTEGQAILIASSDADAEALTRDYIYGVPEDIHSKLAVEPVLRSAVLSVIASRFVNNKQQLFDFFSKTFWAYQYGDMQRLSILIEAVLLQLEEWNFLKKTQRDDFASADKLDDHTPLFATSLGRRVTELYLDPLTAHHLISGLEQATEKDASSFAFLHLLSFTLEMRPFLNVRQKELDNVEEAISLHSPEQIIEEVTVYDEGYDNFLSAAKTALLLDEWIDEKHEDYLLDTFTIRPGELRAKLTTGDWLAYSCLELCTLLDFKKVRTALSKLRWRLKYGAREELLPLLRLRQVGRIRARKLFNNNIQDVKALRNIDLAVLSRLLGSQKIAISLKEQVGSVTKHAKDTARKGQVGLGKF